MSRASSDGNAICALALKPFLRPRRFVGEISSKSSSYLELDFSFTNRWRGKSKSFGHPDHKI